MTYILIDDVAYETNTPEEVEAAKAALREAGHESAPVYAGDPDDPDSHKNGQTLFAE